MNQPLNNDALIKAIQEKLRRLSTQYADVSAASDSIIVTPILSNSDATTVPPAPDNSNMVTIIPVPDENGTVTVEPGCTSLGTIFRGNKEIKRIILPETIEYIEDSAFQDCSGLEQVTLPKSIIKIGSHVFHNCRSLKQIVWPLGTSQVPEYTFYGCTYLENVIVSEDVTAIGMSAFENCTNLQRISIPNAVTRISHAAFKGCTRLENVDYPSKLLFIGESAFCNCESLHTVILPDGIQGIQDGAFMGCSQVLSVYLPNTLLWLGKNAFSGCRSLVSVSLPNSLGLLSEGVFSECENLRSIDLPNSIKRIDRRAFSGCLSLEKVDLPNSLERLGDKCFSECILLRHIAIPENCYSIRSGAFQKCCSLEKVVLHDSVFYIGLDAFAGCIKLQPFPIPRKLANLAVTALDDISKLANENGFIIAGKVLLFYVGKEEVVHVPESITIINYDAFTYCPHVKHVELPKGIQRVDCWHKGEMFADRNGFFVVRGKLYGYYGNEPILIVPENISDVDWTEISRNKAVKKVKLPNNFDGMIRPSSWQLLADDEGFVIIGGELRGYIGSERLVKIPAGVVSIDDYAFSQSPQVSQVVLPEGIASIFVVSDENWQKYVDSNGLVISGSTLIKCYGVSGSLVLPDYISKIDPWAFRGNPALHEVWVPANMGAFLVRGFDANCIKWKSK